jgi:hypothetical protein
MPVPSLTPFPSKTSTPTAIHWIYNLDRFQAHINEYLDPEWTKTAPGYPYIFREGYIRGGLVVVSADTGLVISPLDWEPSYMSTEEPGPPDWGLPFARTPEEVGTVVIVWATREEAFTYGDGAKAYRIRWDIKVVDLAARAVVHTRPCPGDDPKTWKAWGSGDLIGPAPWLHLIRGLRELPTRPASGATVAAPSTDTGLTVATPLILRLIH